MTKEEVLLQCTVEGNIVKLPNIKLERKEYLDVAKSLELIGGKWKGGKISGFVFNSDPTELLSQIASGEKRNLKKEFQFFATPDNLAAELVKLACIEEGNSILEPSAGQGHITRAIGRVFPDKIIHCCELNDVNRIILNKEHNVRIVAEDFLSFNPLKKYDRIIANPPFAKNQDIDHIYKMYEVCADGGVIITIASKHWLFSDNKKENAFRSWVNTHAAIIDVEAGSFKDSGTNISTVILCIQK